MSSTNEEANPHLTDIFRTALGRSDLDQPAESKPTHQIVIHGGNNVVVLGGHVTIQPALDEGN